MSAPQKPLDHPDYRVPGTNLINASKWSRENIPKPPPAFKVGDRVLAEVTVHKVYEDCDGTPLFAIGGSSGIVLLHGWPNESLRPLDLGGDLEE